MVNPNGWEMSFSKRHFDQSDWIPYEFSNGDITMIPDEWADVVFGNAGRMATVMSAINDECNTFDPIIDILYHLDTESVCGVIGSPFRDALDHLAGINIV